MLGCRNELKYLMAPSKAEAVRRYVADYLEVDPYSKIPRDGFYTIGSLYLDSHNLRLYRESVEGHKNRFKLRIRTYDDEPESPCFFEIKRRINTVILKSRTPVSRENAADVMLGRGIHLTDFSSDLEALNQFQLYARNINAEPVIQIKYERFAFESTCNNRVRVTFDRNLCFKTSRTLRLDLRGNGWQRMKLGGMVLEIKFTGRFPMWLNRMAKMFDLHFQSMSKYGCSVSNAALLGFCAPKMPARI